MIDKNYNPNFFIPNNLDHAKQLILTGEDTTTSSRWDQETLWISKTIDSFMDINSNSVILDWGCGIGRISKVLTDTYGCKVVGVDLQLKMLEYAKEYVNNDLFTTVQYENIFSDLPENHFTHAFSVWVFQHSNKIQYEIPLIYKSLKEVSQVFVLELDKKAIPNNSNGFYDDDIPTRKKLEKFFEPEILGKIPLKYTTKKIQDMSWWGILNKI